MLWEEGSRFRTSLFLSFLFVLTLFLFYPFFFSYLKGAPPRVFQNKKTPSHFTSWNRVVREVGFEPTNPYGTGASGLRVQDPTSIRRVSLTWLGNTSRPIYKADSRKHQARSRKNTRPRQGPNWLSPTRQSTKSGQCLIEPRPEPHPTRTPAYPKLPRKHVPMATRRRKT